MCRTTTAIWEEEPKTPNPSPTRYFTGHKPWPLGTINLLLTLLNHYGRERVTRIINFSEINTGQKTSIVSNDYYHPINNEQPKLLHAIVASAIVHILRKRRTTIITIHMVKHKKKKIPAPKTGEKYANLKLTVLEEKGATTSTLQKHRRLSARIPSEAGYL